MYVHVPWELADTPHTYNLLLEGTRINLLWYKETEKKQISYIASYNSSTFLCWFFGLYPMHKLYNNVLL